jgi:hypothetical protein
MSSKKGELKDLFKTPPKKKKRQYTSLDNKLKSQKHIDEETMDMVIILYCFIFLFFLMFIMTIVHTDNINKYAYKSKPQKYSLWESIKMKIFGMPKHSQQLLSNCYIKSKEKCNVTQEEDNINSLSSNSSCINAEGKSCQQINEEWSKGLLANDKISNTNNIKNNNKKT